MTDHPDQLAPTRIIDDMYIIDDGVAVSKVVLEPDRPYVCEVFGGEGVCLVTVPVADRARVATREDIRRIDGAVIEVKVAEPSLVTAIKCIPGVSNARVFIRCWER